MFWLEKAGDGNENQEARTDMFDVGCEKGVAPRGAVKVERSRYEQKPHEDKERDSIDRLLGKNFIFVAGGGFEIFQHP